MEMEMEMEINAAAKIERLHRIREVVASEER